MNNPFDSRFNAACLAGLVLALCSLQPVWGAEAGSKSAKPAKVQVAKAQPAAAAPAEKPLVPLLEREPLKPADGPAEKPTDQVTDKPAGAAAEPQAKAGVASAAATGLDSRIQDVKGDVIRLNRDLLVLEEELLFPANTQVALFVSMDVGKLFSLDSVQVTLDDKVVSNYLYTPLEVQALHRGGVQRMYVGNLKSGEHTLTAFFTGKGPHERDYKRGATLKFEKDTGAKYIELQIKDSAGKLQPEFDVKVWQ
jgi:hypothetical protein